MKATKTPARRNYTAMRTREMASELGLDPPPFYWNIVPFHPHPEGDPLANRRPLVNEVRRGAELLRRILAVLDFDHTISIGRVAEDGLKRIGVDSHYVRHPSMGGINKFRRQLHAFYQGSDESGEASA